jgi:hypothetical protein
MTAAETTKDEVMWARWDYLWFLIGAFYANVRITEPEEGVDRSEIYMEEEYTAVPR